MLEKLAYTLLNPVRVGLVGRARAWGGATSASMRFGGRRILAYGRALSYVERLRRLDSA